MLTDIIANNLSILFCGINPGLKSALDEHHFSGKSNRFWKVLHLAGFTPYQIEAINDTDILIFGYGLTTAVERPTVRADELSKEEFELSFEIFQEKIAHYNPRYIAFLGKPAYAVFSGKKNITWGKQSEKIQNATVWILPNPSGLNQGFNIENLTSYYTELYNEINKV
ncbi:G/U mismatch-specific DNA glycosylase [Chryseobacterium mulctrae]|uniref:G/U mismatch-specific DNA glycosylase n=1 Tax=Chryseobacterium mulctrae TaxID=2576777 RepID=UPI00111726A4|nr:G/U mismatch-specific DNA glycosylase [Chryseobacterium mulctrae]